MIRLRDILRSQAGAAAAEFALVLPIALLFMFGIIDVGRYVWTMSELEKAVQMGTRYAVATAVVAEDLRGESYIDNPDCGEPLKAGDPICKEALPTIICTRTACGSGGPADEEAFDRILERMQKVAPQISAADVTVSYSGSDLGFAGDPVADEDGVAIAPIVTVAVSPKFGMRALSALGMTMRLPSFSYSQTLEDGDGAVAY